MATLTFQSTDGTLVIGELDHVCRAEENRYLALASNSARPLVHRRLMVLRVAERRLCLAATPAQWGIGWGGHVAVLMPELLAHTARAAGFDGNVYRLMPGEWPAAIYGQVYTRGQVRDGERKARDKLALAGALGMDEIAAHASADAWPVIASAHRAGWRYGQWFSGTGPEGELGMHHVAHLAPITEQEFLAARRDGWAAEVPT